MSDRERAVLVFDGDCAFCTSCARILQGIGPDAQIVPWQLADLAELGITEQQAADAVQWVALDGTVRSGHEAIAAILKTAGPIWKGIGRAILAPGISWLAARVYRLVADNRSRLPGGTPACAVSTVPRGQPTSSASDSSSASAATATGGSSAASASSPKLTPPS
jgi:predicted DCC family thiol-disulfide oxidoreductase YuxK